MKIGYVFNKTCEVQLKTRVNYFRFITIFVFGWLAELVFYFARNSLGHIETRP